MKKQIEIMEKVRAGVCLANSGFNSKDELFEIFMGIFHPEIHKDRKRMYKLHKALKK